MEYEIQRKAFSFLIAVSMMHDQTIDTGLCILTWFSISQILGHQSAFCCLFIRAMIRQICNVRPQDIVTTRSNELLVRLGIEDLDLILKERRLRWYGHVERSSGAIKTAFDIQVDGKRGPVGPKMTWKQLTVRDCREWKLLANNPHDLV